MALSPEFVSFFEELASNNHKDWFDANRKRYHKHVKEPFYQLVEKLIAGMKERDDAIDIEPKHAVFRINRDIRFSKDKTPYKLNVAAVIAPQGRKDMTYPGLYIHIAPHEFWIGGGIYKPSKEVLLAMRTWMANHKEEVEKALEDKAFRSTFGELKGEKNKRLPKEFAKAAERLPVLYNKGFYYMRVNEGASEVTRPDLAEYALKTYDDASAVNAVLRKAAAS